VGAAQRLRRARRWLSATATEVPLRGRARRATLTAVRRPVSLTIMSLLLAVALGLPAAANARHGGDGNEVRAAGTCGGDVHSQLKLKARDGGIEAEVEVDHARSGSSWRVTHSQEGRVVWRGSVRAGSGSFSLARRLRDLAGADRVGVRASGPRGVTCRAAATLPGD
jgi:hypothetical protein